MTNTQPVASRFYLKSLLLGVFSNLLAASFIASLLYVPWNSDVRPIGPIGGVFILGLVTLVAGGALAIDDYRASGRRWQGMLAGLAGFVLNLVTLPISWQWSDWIIHAHHLRLS